MPGGSGAASSCGGSAVGGGRDSGATGGGASGSGSSGDGVAGGVAEAAPKAKAQSKAKKTVVFTYSAPPGSRSVTIGGRELAELWPDQSHDGYNLACQYHTGCNRSCGFGKKLGMSPIECRRRLLRWEVAGRDLQGSLEEKIAQHRELGSSKLLSPAFGA